MTSSESAGSPAVSGAVELEAERIWLVLKRNLYWRPNDQGYTGIKDHAARYTEEEARVRVGDGLSGVTMMPESDAPEFTAACYDDLARDHLVEQRDALRADNERLGRELELSRALSRNLGVLNARASSQLSTAETYRAAAEAERDTLLAQVGKMRSALEPFAAAAEHFDGHVKDGDVVPISLRHIRARHVFAASAALTKEPS